MNPQTVVFRIILNNFTAQRYLNQEYMIEMNGSETYLSDLQSGDTGVITKVHGHGSFRKRITEMGFVRGKKVRVIKNAPLQDPIEYEIMGYRVSLRRSEACLIETVSVEQAKKQTLAAFEGTMIEEYISTVISERSRTITWRW